MTSIPTAGIFNNGATTNQDAKDAQDDMLSVLREMIGGNALSTLTIATGSITPTRGMHLVDTEGSTATDDLDAIAQTNHPDGRLLVISNANNSRTVVVRHAQGGTGQILLADAANLSLANTTQFLVLRRNGTSWEEVWRSWGSQKSSFRTWLDVVVSGSTLKTGKREIPTNATMWTPAASNGCGATTITNIAASKPDLIYKTFSDSVQQYATLWLPLPKSYNNGTIEYQVIWSHPTAVTNFGVRWEMDAVAFGDSDALNAAFGTAVGVSDEGGTADDVFVTDWSAALTIGGTPQSGDIVCFRLSRVVSYAGAIPDNLAVSARLIGVRFRINLSSSNDE